MVDDAPARRQIAELLRSRRARVRPEDAGLPAAPRRRSPGLRREEVAVLAGVSTTWYTYLEQGREVNPSRSVLDALARVLRLDSDERRLLHQLNDTTSPLLETSDGDRGMDGAELARYLVALDEASPYPTYACDVHCDVIAWNPATADYYTDFGQLPPEQRNMVHWMFASDQARERLPDWTDVARDLVTRWHRLAIHADPERLATQLDEYRSLEPLFGTWWDTQNVSDHHTTLRRFTHPTLEDVTLRLVVTSAPGLGQSIVVRHGPAPSEQVG
jgi:transcriptional regulator with XRE-family HTH domain